MKSHLGQYFTTNPQLKEKVVEFILNCPTTILEPSIGQGDLIACIADHLPQVSFDMVEIDETIPLLDRIKDKKDEVIYGDFMKQFITKTYLTIVGNPPYVRTKKGNLYIDFTEKCVKLLADNGELIFIVPSDFLKLTSASKLLNKMMTEGTFTHIFHPHNEKMFENASVDVMVFRYVKNILIDKKVLYNGQLRYVINRHGLITLEEEANNIGGMLFQEEFDIYVGLVSGKEEVYKNEEHGNIEVLNGEDKVDKYIYIEKFPCNKENINQYLLTHKETLMKRKIQKFNETNWFEWGAPRNMTAIRSNLGKDCIYLCNLTRKSTVAFLGKVSYFGGSLIMLKPKLTSTKQCDLNKVVAYLNQSAFKNNYMFSGRFKIGHRQISNSYLPSDCW